MIVILFFINIVALSILWMQTFTKDEPRQNNSGYRMSESVNLMKEVLNLTDSQAVWIGKTRDNQLEQSREYNDRLTILKKEIAEEIFNQNPDTALVAAKSKEIGELQSMVEMIRFKHFTDILSICTPEQKEKFKPILVEIFGRKPPKDELKEKEHRVH